MIAVILLTEILLVISMAGLLIVAIGLAMRHGDPSAIYRLYAIRDQLVASVVFKGVDRENPWLVALYENVNRVLRDSPELRPLPADHENYPETLRTLLPELRVALELLGRKQRGIGIFQSAQEKYRRRIQRKNASVLLQTIAGAFWGRPYRR